VKKEIAEIYDYKEADGTLRYQVVRYYPKTFRQRRPDGQGGWIWDLKGVTPLLYNLPAVVDAVGADKPIYLVEGEKDANNLIAEGLTATTMSGGAKAKWLPQYTETLKGATVVMIPDDDKAGYEWTQHIGDIIDNWTKMLKIINLDFRVNGHEWLGWKDGVVMSCSGVGKDITDWLKDHTVKELEQLILETDPFIPSNVVTRDVFDALDKHVIYIHNELITLKQYRSKRKHEDKV